MTQFAQRLSGRVDRAVVDKTAVPANSAAAAEAGLSLFAALQEQIGSKLSPDKGAVRFLIIDHVEKPAEN